MGLPLSRPFLGIEEQEAIIEVVKSKYIASGQVTRDFEDALAARFKWKYCTVVNSGTVGLYLAIKISGLKTIILPAITCPGVLHAVLNAGAKPLLADVEPETHNIDLSSISERQLQGADGLIVTHTYGHAADMKEIAQYVEKYNLSLVEDFAQAMGGYFQEQIVGSMGKISTTSFYAGKNMTTGYGGAIFTDDPEVYQKCLYLRGDTPYDYYKEIFPLNYKLTDIQSALGLVQLRKINQMVEMRRNAAKKLSILLKNLGITTPVEKPGIKHTYYKYHIVLPEYLQKRKFREGMASEGIATGDLYEPPLHKTIMAKAIFEDTLNLPVAENISGRTVSLPMFPEMTDEDIHRIYYSVDKVLKMLKETGDNSENPNR
jgi:perosamine synthetase